MQETELILDPASPIPHPKFKTVYAFYKKTRQCQVFF